MILDLQDITDELIYPVVEKNQNYLIFVDEYIGNLLVKFGSTKTINDIPKPIPFAVKELAVAYLGYRVCRDKFGGQVGVTFKGADGTDRWYTKLKHYKSLCDELSAGINLEVLLGESARTSICVDLWRA